jgi:hypothetical protein
MRFLVFSVLALGMMANVVQAADVRHPSAASWSRA